MIEEEDNTFADYILGKKLRLLHLLCERLYSFAEYSRKLDPKIWNIHLQDDEDNCTAEIRGSEMLSIDERLRIHTLCYKALKPKDSVYLGPNGQQYLFMEISDVR